MDGAVGRDGARSGTEDRAPAPDLYRREASAVDANREASRADHARGRSERSDLIR